jgi:WS/DGAT/MGAT family acyltransferase
MESLSPQDAGFLFVENEVNHMHIAVVAIFEGPPPTSGEVEEMIASKLDRVPRYRQRVRFVPFGMGQPVWIDDAKFDLAYHVRHTALPSPGGATELHNLVGRVMSQKLDRGRPLWEAWVVEGLESGRWAILSKTHHCMVDGVSGADLLSVLLDTTPDAAHPDAGHFEPRWSPSVAALLADAMWKNWKRPTEGLSALGRSIGKPRRALRALADFTDGLASFRELSTRPVESSLNGPIGPHRRWRTAGTTLADIKKIRSAHGGTVNDVVLAAIAQGFRTLLLHRGEPVDGFVVRSLVPVSMRREEERGQFNNRIAGVIVELPMGLSDPIERLAAVRQEMDRLKSHHQAEATETIGALSGYAPPVLLELGARLFADLEQHAVQTVTTNVPGPRQPLYAAGHRMVAAFPYVPIAGSFRLGIAIFSYAGQVSFGITGDYESTSDIDVLAHGIEKGIADLLAAS